MSIIPCNFNKLTAVNANVQMETERIKIFHIEDYQIMRDGMRALFAKDQALELVGQTSNDEDFFKGPKNVSIDVLVLDIHLDPREDLQHKDGFEICKAIHQAYPAVKIIAHTAYDHADVVDKFIKAGGVGFVSKRSTFDELIRAIKVVHSGQVYVCSSTAKKLKNLDIFLLGFEPQLQSLGDRFSKREREVMDLLAKGWSSREISDRLSIAERTVDTHRKNLIVKAGVKNTVHLIAYAGSQGLLQ